MVRFIHWIFPGTSDSVAAGWSADALTTNPPATVAAVFRSMGTLMVPAGRAGTVRVPALVAVGSRDPLLPQCRWLASVWPGARLLVVEGADHGSIIGRPELWVAVRTLVRARTAARTPGRPALVSAHAP